jgi:LEA14-like dessication related protein
MNNLLIAGLAGVLVIAGGTGYAAVTFEKPSFGVIDMGDWKEVNKDSITVVSDAWINNPNPIGLSVGFIDVRYAAEVNNITLAEGEIDKVSLNSGNNTQEFETQLKQGGIPEWWISHVENGENSTVSVPVNIGTPVNSLEIQVFSKEVSTDITSRIENSLESIEGEYTGPGIETTR